MKASDDAFTDRSIDQQLKQLAIVAQQQAPKSRERQRVLARFIAAIERSGKLTRPGGGNFRDSIRRFMQKQYSDCLPMFAKRLTLTILNGAKYCSG